MKPLADKSVEVTYLTCARRKLRAPAVVLACYNTMIPYLCPEIPAQQKEALAYAERVPLIYTNVAIRNWKAFQKLGVQRISYPNGYFSSAEMDFPVSIGDYHFTDSPDQPCVLHMLRTPCRYGVPAKEQYRAGRRDMQSTPFTTYERNIRDQLGRALGPGGFDPAKDVQAITGLLGPRLRLRISGIVGAPVGTFKSARTWSLENSSARSQSLTLMRVRTRTRMARSIKRIEQLGN